MTPTEYFVLIVMILIPLAWEAYTIYRDDLRTISIVWAEWGREWNPFLAYGTSGLIGHFFVTPPWTAAQFLTEPAESGAFLVGGWAVFLTFHNNRGRLPLPWWGMLLVCAIGFGVGALVWTIGA